MSHQDHISFILLITETVCKMMTYLDEGNLSTFSQGNPYTYCVQRAAFLSNQIIRTKSQILNSLESFFRSQPRMIGFLELLYPLLVDSEYFTYQLEFPLDCRRKLCQTGLLCNTCIVSKWCLDLKAKFTQEINCHPSQISYHSHEAQVQVLGWVNQVWSGREYCQYSPS